MRQRYNLLDASEGVARGRGVGPAPEDVLDCLGEADCIDWSPASLDSASVPAPGRLEDQADPTDKGK